MRRKGHPMRGGGGLSAWVILLVAVMLAALAVQCVTSLVTETATLDELQFIGRGISHLMIGTAVWGPFLIGDHHAPLPFMFSAAPLLFTRGIQYPPCEAEWLHSGIWRFGRYFFFDLNMGRAEGMVNRCRCMTVLFSLLLALLVFHFARKLHGTGAGLFALFLQVFSPTVLAFSRYAVDPVYTAFFILLAVCAFHDYMRNPTARTLVFAGAAFGLAQLAKFSATLLIPCFVVLAAMDNVREGGSRGLVGRLGGLALVFALGYLVVWAGYGFTTGSLSDVRIAEHFIGGRGAEWEFPDAARLSPAMFHPGRIPLVPYVRGLWELWRHNRMGHPAFLMGEVSRNGWWYYYIVAFCIKSPIPLLALLAMTVLLHRKFERGERPGDAYLIVPLCVTFGISLMSRQALGLRHIFVTYPLLHIYLSGVVTVRPSGAAARVLLRLCLAALCAWYLRGTVRIRPHYLAYFNEFIGGPKNGYKYLVDSNLDWGQDLKGVKGYMAEHHIDHILFEHAGFSAFARYYGIDYERLSDRLSRARSPEEAHIKGVVMVSATARADLWDPERRLYNWISRHEPVDSIGYSILVYRF